MHDCYFTILFSILFVYFVKIKMPPNGEYQ